MAGFFRRVSRSFFQNDIGSFLKELATLGVKNKTEILRNSHAVGYGEENVTFGFGQNMDDIDFINVMNDINNKYLPFFDRNYVDRRNFLRNLSKEDQIERVLTILTDESIVYDDNNYFCKLLDLDVNFKNKDAIQKTLETNFKKIYNLLGFNDLTTAWWLYYKMLIDGFLSFEIVYDSNKKNIIGFKELDPVTLSLSTDLSSGKQVWVQYQGDSAKERVLFDSQIIYISYSSSLVDSRTSYVERLVKPYNILTTMEQTRLTWAVVNASYRMKFIIPMGGKTKQQARQSLRKLMNHYREEISFDSSNGRFHVQGKPYFPGVRHIWLPERNGNSPTMEPMGGDGPDLSDTEALVYFRDRFDLATKIPKSRLRDEGGGLTIDNSGSQITQEEVKFNRFVIRLRSIFKEIILKPLRLQTILDHPNLKDDINFENAIKIEYTQYNLFEELKDMEIMEKKIDHVERLSQLVDPDGKPYFEMGWLIKKYKVMSEEEIKENKKAREKRKKELKDSGDWDGENTTYGLS